MSIPYKTLRDSKTLEIEEFTREGISFRLVITLRKLGVVTMLDYLISPEEAEEIASTLSKTGEHKDSNHEGT